MDGPSLVPAGAGMCERPVVLLLHGGMGYDHTYFKPDFRRLTDVAQIVYLDFRGMGRSAEADPESWDYELLADDLRAFCNALGIVKPIVFGHSMAGPVAMLFAGHYPDHPGGLILQSCMARFDLDRVVAGFRRIAGDEVAAIARRFYRGDSSVTMQEWSRCRTAFGPWSPDEQVRARIQLHPELAAVGMIRLCTLNITDQLGKISCPTLVCVGDRDPVTQPDDAREIADALTCSDKRLRVLQGGGHFLWKDVPDSYWPLIQGFVVEANPTKK
ncbi:MAG TPA: alpha/beta hydrolase [candidate division Zixibacteria bacterium]